MVAWLGLPAPADLSWRAGARLAAAGYCELSALRTPESPTPTRSQRTAN